jgi:hypothetical protein
MEQKRNVEDILAAIGGDEDDSFDRFLERKTEWKPSEQDIISKLKEQPIAESAIARPESDAPVSDAVESSKPLTVSSETAGTDITGLPPGARGAVEYQTRVSLHKVQVAGHTMTYTTETTEEISVDSEWQSEFVKTRESALLLTAEEIIEQRHQLNRAIFLINARQQGLKISLEEVLKSRDSADRQALLDLDRKYRAKPTGKTKKDKAKTEKQEKSIGKAAGTKGMSKGMKTAQTLKNLEMDKEAVVAKLEVLGQYDEMTANFVNKLFA